MAAGDGRGEMDSNQSESQIKPETLLGITSAGDALRIHTMHSYIPRETKHIADYGRGDSQEGG